MHVYPALSFGLTAALALCLGSVAGCSSGRQAADSGASGGAGSDGSGTGGTGGIGGTGGVGGTGGAGGTGGTGGTAGTGGNGTGGTGASIGTVVAMVQSGKAQASELTADDIRALVVDAVAKAGGLDFIHDGQTVVLKPNLLTTSVAGAPLAPEVNGITTDWRLTRAVADLVRAKNPTGKILIMEGSVVPTRQAFSQLGYTTANFGASVDEFIAIEGSSCTDRSTTALVQKPSVDGKQFWVNQRYFSADVVISLPVMKTHGQAGITGAVKNLAIGTTPVGQYSSGTNANDCTRGQTAAHVDHSREGLATFVYQNFSIRPADFVVMDALQAIQNGPNPAWTGGNYANDKMNMRLVLAARNAVALDTIATLAMRCDATQIGYLTRLEASGFGTTDPAKIQVVGKQVSEVSKRFAGPSWACP